MYLRDGMNGPARAEKSPPALPELSSHTQQRLLESIVATTRDAVVITDAQPPGDGEAIILHVNAAFTRMTGYSPAEAVGRAASMLSGPDTDGATRACIRSALRTGEPVTVDILNYRKDGRPLWVELSAVPLTDESGSVTHWIAIRREIAGRRRAPATKRRPRLAAADGDALDAARTAHDRLRARLAYSTAHDDVGSMFNRTDFMERLDVAIARAQSEPEFRYSLMYLDLDRFKDLNDWLGYRWGDRIIAELARRLTACTRVSDTVARVGGDEFGILLELPAGSGDVLDVADRMLMAIASIPEVSANDVALTASIGIVHSLADYDDAQAVLRDAQTAMQRARQRTGNSFVVFTGEMRDEAHVALRIRNDLHGAVARGEMRLYYQPLVDTAAGRVYGFEALIRWVHPERGLILPSEFIATAEANGLIVEIGRWVLGESVRMACDLQTRAGRSILMSVNVSSRQLMQPHFVEDLQALLATSGLAPSRLQLEITESIFLGSAGVVGTLLARIRELGVKIAFDDFGTGYSSLGYLERFQIDALKIDGSFVARIDDASAKSEIVRMIVALAHALGVDVVAEGVESRAQRDALGSLGCTHHQGYLFSRPLPAAEVAAVLDHAHPEARGLSEVLRETAGAGATAPLSPAASGELRDAVQTAATIHRAWMERVHSAIETGSAASESRGHDDSHEDQCPLGRWLSTEISDELRRMPLYFVTLSRHAVLHRSMARLFAAVAANEPTATLRLRYDGDVAVAMASLLRALDDWLAIGDLAGSSEGQASPEKRARRTGGRAHALPAAVRV